MPGLANQLSSPFFHGLSAGFGLIAIPIYLGILGPIEYGAAIILTTLATVSSIGNIGIAPTFIYCINISIFRERPDVLKSIVSNLVIILSVIYALIFLLFANQIFQLLNINKNSGLNTAILNAIFLWSIFLFQIENQFIFATNKVFESSVFEFARLLISLVFFLALDFLDMQGRDRYLSAQCLSYVATGTIIRRRYHRFESTNGALLEDYKFVLKHGLVYALNSSLTLGLMAGSKIMSGILFGPATTSYYEIGLNVSMKIRSLIEKFFKAISPNESKGIEFLNHRSRSLVTVMGVVFLVTFGVAIILLVVSQFFDVWLGDEYGNEISILYINLIPGVSLGSSCAFFYYYFIATGRKWIILKAQFLQLILFLAALALFLFSDKLEVAQFSQSVSLGMFFSNIYLLMNYLNLNENKT